MRSAPILVRGDPVMRSSASIAAMKDSVRIAGGEVDTKDTVSVVSKVKGVGVK